MNEIYNEEGKFILHHVSKDKPCWVCDAEDDNAHTNFCPNIMYLKQKLEIKNENNK